MSQQQHPTRPPQLSPDGQWWWDGAQWQPVHGRPRRSTLKRTLLILAAAVGTLLVAGVLLLFLALNRPLGTQHDTDELDGDYCAYFPEDC